MTTSEPITLQLPSELMQQVQKIAGNSEALQTFVIGAIEHEIERQQISTGSKTADFWDRLQELRSKMQAEGIEIDPDEIWKDVRDRSPGREVNL
jgi:predicted transcriptional regulator